VHGRSQPTLDTMHVSLKNRILYRPDKSRLFSDNDFKLFKRLVVTIL